MATSEDEPLGGYRNLAATVRQSVRTVSGTGPLTINKQDYDLVPLPEFEPSATPPAINITKIPVEIQLDIIANLPFRDKAVLRATSEHFRHLIPALTHDDLLVAELEDYARIKDLFTCKFCKQMKDRSGFAKSMLKGKTGRNGSRRYNRFCLYCGFRYREGSYQFGQWILTGDGTSRSMCEVCLKLVSRTEQPGYRTTKCTDCCRPAEKRQALRRLFDEVKRQREESENSEEGRRVLEKSREDLKNYREQKLRDNTDAVGGMMRRRLPVVPLWIPLGVAEHNRASGQELSRGDMEIQGQRLSALLASLSKNR